MRLAKSIATTVGAVCVLAFGAAHAQPAPHGPPPSATTQAHAPGWDPRQADWATGEEARAFETRFQAARARLDQDTRSHRLDPRTARLDLSQLNNVRSLEKELEAKDHGHLSRDHLNEVSQRLDALSRQVP